MAGHTRSLADFYLYNHLTSNAPAAKAVLAGSATPSLSLNDIISLSNDANATTAALTTDLTKLPLALASNEGSEQLRANIASTYSGIKAGNVIVANGTTGANHIVERSLLSANDHVIVQYPIYGPCIEEPRSIGCEVSFLRLDLRDWSVDVDQIEALIKPGKTKMIVLNNPVNPTGSQLDTETQRAIIKIAKKHNLVIHCDEIFRPFFHASKPNTTIPPSIVEHPDLEYDGIVVTSSLSKCYGLSGVRIGWVTTRSPELLKIFLNYRMFSVHALPQIDEAIATEVLGPRCRQAIIDKHLHLASRNLDLIEEFIEQHPSQCEWVRPTAGAVAFIKFNDKKTGQAYDDVDFADRLFKSTGVLLAPGSNCFEFDEEQKSRGDFKGMVRMHFTCVTDTLEKGLKGLTQFLKEEEKQQQQEANGAP